MIYILKRAGEILLEYFIADIINLFVFIVFAILAGVILVYVDNAKFAYGLIGTLFILTFIIAVYLTYLYHRKKG